MVINLIVNGLKKRVLISPDEVLLDTLRKLGYTSVKRGCDTGACGLCTVLVNGKPTLSCSTLTIRVHGKNIETIEGKEKEAKLFSDILSNEGGDQCGYCVPGFVLTVLALKEEIKNPTDEEILHYMNGNLCRCTGYNSHLRAIKKYLEVIKK